MRKLNEDWITSYTKWLSPITEAPENFVFWTAVACISATLRRRVWYDRIAYKVYPHQYIVLVGHQGVGKGSAILPAVELMREAGTVNLLADRTTIEYIVERLAKGFPGQTTNPNGSVSFGTDSSALIAASELSVFVTASQYTLPVLADLWDAKDAFEYMTKTQGKHVVHNPCVNLLGGSTTQWLVEAMPVSAMGGGFTRRVNFVYAKDSSKPIPFPTKNGANTHFQNLVDDLRHVSTLQGEIKLADKQTENIYDKYYCSCTTNEFDSEIVSGYRTTKRSHVIKVATALAVGESDQLVIQRTHLERAIAEVDAVEASVEHVFRAVGDSELVSATDRVLRFIENKGFASRADILRANWRHISSSDLDVVITTLSQGGLIREVTAGHKILYEAVVQMP